MAKYEIERTLFGTVYKEIKTIPKNLHAKEKGEIIELRFKLKCVEKDFIIATPEGDSAPYDVIIDNCGKLFKVQIKSKSYRQKRKDGHGYSIQLAHGGGIKYKYTAKEVDVFAVYIIPIDIWYLIPHQYVSYKSINVYPHNNYSKGQYELFKENWDVFEGP